MIDLELSFVSRVVPQSAVEASMALIQFVEGGVPVEGDVGKSVHDGPLGTKWKCDDQSQIDARQNWFCTSYWETFEPIELERLACAQMKRLFKLYQVSCV